VGANCLWSPASINLSALLIGIKTLGIVACAASSIIAISKLVSCRIFDAAEEFVVKIT